MKQTARRTWAMACLFTLVLLATGGATSATDSESAAEFFQVFEDGSAEIVTRSLEESRACYPDDVAPADVRGCIAAIKRHAEALQGFLTALEEVEPPASLALPVSDYMKALEAERVALVGLAAVIGVNEEEAQRLSSEALDASISSYRPRAAIDAAAPEPEFGSDGFDWLILLPVAAGAVAVSAAATGLFTSARTGYAFYEVSAPSEAPAAPRTGGQALSPDATPLQVAIAAAADFSRMVSAMEARTSQKGASPYKVAAISGVFAITTALITRL